MAKRLTLTEMRVYKEALAPISRKEIAAALKMSPRSVYFHLANIYRKKGVAGRMELIAAGQNREEAWTRRERS